MIRLGGVDCAAAYLHEPGDAKDGLTVNVPIYALNQVSEVRVQELSRYRSEFFGRLREVLGDRQDIRIVGDRFVFQSEVLFPAGSEQINDAGQVETGDLRAGGGRGAGHSCASMVTRMCAPFAKVTALDVGKGERVSVSTR